MVARRFDTKTVSGAFRELVAELFEAWRHVVTRLVGVLALLRARVAPAERFAPAPRSWLLRPAVAWSGALALALGAVLGVALAQPGLPRSLAIWAGVQSLLWAAVRWLLMRFTARGAARDSAVLLGASSLGLLAYAFAVNPELRVAAWVLSATLTWFALVRLGDREREAARTVGIAWGAQALVVIGSWIARNGVMAFLAGRG